MPPPDPVRPPVLHRTLVNSLRLGDTLWNETIGLLRMPATPERHGVRESAWYALGLLMRASPGDLPRALRALDTVLDHQLHAPGTD